MRSRAELVAVARRLMTADIANTRSISAPSRNWSTTRSASCPAPGARDAVGQGEGARRRLRRVRHQAGRAAAPAGKDQGAVEAAGGERRNIARIEDSEIRRQISLHSI